MKITDPTLIVDQQQQGKNASYTIKRVLPTNTERETKLSDVFDEMPHGVVLKEETGLGATTLELTAKRNSIIVEPLKITASSKAKNSTEFPALYVGSPTKFHPDKLENSHITAYINDDTIEFKKIMVVADSLDKLINCLGNSVYTDYFFMIDEIDSFQLDSFYRNRMEESIDFYKKFPKDKRAMVSATVMGFSDPELANEPVTTIRYDTPTSRNINIFYAPRRIKAAAISKIKKLLQQDPKAKIMIAYNSVKGCFEIAKHLNNKHGIDNEKIKIFCSAASKEVVKEYYAELEENTLPVQFNFMTSAYFTGFDLTERYHLISISSNLSSVHSLSDKRLKQIAGRCRDKEGLLSETIIYNILKEDDSKEVYDLPGLLKAAEKEIMAMKCIDVHYSEHPLLKSIYQEVMSNVIKHTKISGFTLVRNKYGQAQISYLNMDAYLEHIRVRKELYLTKEALPSALEKAGHKVKEIKLSQSDNPDSTDIDKISRQEKIEKTIEILRSLPRIISPSSIITKESNFSLLQEYIIRSYNKLYKYVDRDSFLDLLEEKSKERDSRSINNLFEAAYFMTLDPNNLYKRTVYFHIPIGQEFTKEELLEKWKAILLDCGIPANLRSTSKAVKLTNLHFEVTKKRNPHRHFIKSDKPYKIEILKHRHQKDNEKELWHPSVIKQMHT